MNTHNNDTAMARQARKQSGTGIYHVKNDQRALDLGRFACKESPMISNCLKELVNNPMTIDVISSKMFEWQIGSMFASDPEISSLPNPYPMGNVEIDNNTDPAKYINDLSTGETNCTMGKTLFPDLIGAQNSTNSNVQIYLNSGLSPQGKAEAFSHEGYGHTLLYFRTNYDHQKASHQYAGNIDENSTLRPLIIKAKLETIKNNRK